MTGNAKMTLWLLRQNKRKLICSAGIKHSSFSLAWYPFIAFHLYFILISICQKCSNWFGRIHTVIIIAAEILWWPGGLRGGGSLVFKRSREHKSAHWKGLHISLNSLSYHFKERSPEGQLHERFMNGRLSVPLPSEWPTTLPLQVKMFFRKAAWLVSVRFTVY